MRRSFLVTILVLALLASLAPHAAARAPWKRRIDRYARGHSISISVRDHGKVLYQHAAKTRRTPASNEKLLVSMALLDRVPSKLRIKTIAAAASPAVGVVPGDVWLLGRGDPTVTGGGRYGRRLPMTPTRLGKLARRMDEAGIVRIEGSIIGSTSYFGRDHFAPGWKPNFPAEEVPLPSALSYEGNVHKGNHTATPERRAAKRLTRLLEKRGVRVRGAPTAGPTPGGLTRIAIVRSAPLAHLLRYMNRTSSNFFAEMLGKRLAVESGRRPGTIAGGAAALEGWARRRGVDVQAFDASGLSYQNRVSANGTTKLLTYTEEQPWGPTLRTTLAGADEGTLDDRLGGVKLRAKTGTLTNISTLSGWVWLRRTKSWAEFSIMSNGMYKSTAADIEDDIVRELTRSAR
ncbi:MAG TPA: D-alanyl-D-alanine carboxypeptidase [Actinomycetota bacterium]|nr:D-alanyl-D-alanine carboxypeptidase [Actinomycetota bacterium]